MFSRGYFQSDDRVDQYEEFDRVNLAHHRTNWFGEGFHAPRGGVMYENRGVDQMCLRRTRYDNGIRMDGRQAPPSYGGIGHPPSAGLNDNRVSGDSPDMISQLDELIACAKTLLSDNVARTDVQCSYCGSLEHCEEDCVMYSELGYWTGSSGEIRAEQYATNGFSNHTYDHDPYSNTYTSQWHDYYHTPPPPIQPTYPQTQPNYEPNHFTLPNQPPYTYTSYHQPLYQEATTQFEDTTSMAFEKFSKFMDAQASLNERFHEFMEYQTSINHHVQASIQNLERQVSQLAKQLSDEETRELSNTSTYNAYSFGNGLLFEDTDEEELNEDGGSGDPEVESIDGRGNSHDLLPFPTNGDLPLRHKRKQNASVGEDVRRMEDFTKDFSSPEVDERKRQKAEEIPWWSFGDPWTNPNKAINKTIHRLTPNQPHYPMIGQEHHKSVAALVSYRSMYPP